jgi:sugar lactone lactonase YvrE
MKQSTGRLSNARLLSRNTAVGIAAAAAVALVVAACGGNSKTPCPNLPLATAEIGQASYTVAQPDTKVDAQTIGGLQGSVAVNGSTLYVADTNRNRILGYHNIPTTAGAAADFVIGQADLNSNIPDTSGAASGAVIGLRSPGRVWVDPTGAYLVVADTGNNRVLIWNPVPTSGSEAPKVVVGQPNFTTNDANYVASGLNNPAADNLNGPTSAVIANGKLVVVDKGNNRVLIWKTVPTTALSSADFVLGQQSMSTNSQAGDIFVNPTTTDPNGHYQIGMRQPSDAWYTGDHMLVSDTGNNRVLLYNGIPNSLNPTADNVIGQLAIGSTSTAGGSGTQGLNTPWGVTSDDNNVFVADSGNNRVVEYVSAFGRNQQPANYVFGQQDFAHNTANDPDQNNQVGDQRNNPATIGPTQGTLNNPRGVTLTANGTQLIVSDTANSRVTVYAATAGVDGTHTDLCN